MRETEARVQAGSNWKYAPAGLARRFEDSLGNLVGNAVGDAELYANERRWGLASASARGHA
jgi:hypothetical protein